MRMGGVPWEETSLEWLLARGSHESIQSLYTVNVRVRQQHAVKVHRAKVSSMGWKISSWADDTNMEANDNTINTHTPSGLWLFHNCANTWMSSASILSKHTCNRAYTLPSFWYRSHQCFPPTSRLSGIPPMYCPYNLYRGYIFLRSSVFSRIVSYFHIILPLWHSCYVGLHVSPSNPPRLFRLFGISTCQVVSLLIVSLASLIYIASIVLSPWHPGHFPQPHRPVSRASRPHLSTPSPVSLASLASYISIHRLVTLTSVLLCSPLPSRSSNLPSVSSSTVPFLKSPVRVFLCRPVPQMSRPLSSSAVPFLRSPVRCLPPPSRSSNLPVRCLPPPSRPLRWHPRSRHVNIPSPEGHVARVT